jgi:type VI secretion system secreted protein Hcp
MSIDLYLQLDGIPGDSTEQSHERWIPITGVDWSMSQTAGAAHGGGVGGGGGGAGRPSFGSLTVAGRLGTATPRLLDACARGIHVPRAVLEAVAPGERPRLTARWELEGVIISALAVADAGAGAALADSTSLTYERIRLTTFSQDPDGGAGQAVSGGWDIPAARPW